MKTLCLALLSLGVVSTLSAQTPSVSNLSTRAQVGTGGDIIITGFNIGAGSNKTILIRAIGPAIAAAPFNVPGTLADPRLELFSGATKIAENDNWGTAVGNATLVTAATFTSVGAFQLPAGSRDAALLVTLGPGAYTAQVSGVGAAATGVALVEVYEVGAVGARLTNISTRAQVGTGGNILIPGLVISPGSGTRRLLVRAAGPSLSTLGVTGTLANPTMTVLSASGATVATNNDWGTPVGAGAASAAALSAAFTQAGAFNFAANSLDSALLADFGPGNYTIQVSGVGNTSGVAIVEVYDLTPTGPATVTLVASKSSANETGALEGEFTVTRAGDTFAPLTVNYGVSGSATNGVDYPPLLGSVTIPAGATSVTIPIQPFADTLLEPTETVTLTLASGENYVVGSAATATVTIADNPGTLYIATLRPASGAANSAASGLATIVLSASGTYATVNVQFSNLSSNQVGAHLFLGNSTAPGDYVLNLPLGQVTGAQWNIGPTGTYTSAQILDALRRGLIYVGLDTGNYPSGEVRGAFLTAIGSQTFTPPDAPPPVSLTNISATDAARLLTQGTFGPKKSEIDALTGGSVNAWIDAQIAAPASLHRPVELAEWEAAKAASSDPANVQNSLAFRRRAWHEVILAANNDQLRQRVAFALSQILVVGDDPFGNGQTEGITHYYDTLVTNAFGNFRTLLERVTLHPIMGIYLSSLRNAKADPVAGTYPDENYAREVMQLFSIGLVMLQPDGTLKLETDGLPIPTYNNTTITEMAKVFTGWGYANTNPTSANFRSTRADYINPMTMYSAFHETGEKKIVNGVVIPANTASNAGVSDLKIALDTLTDHPNCAPFISKQLIQRLVTDNPSPAYVYRVARVFKDQKDSPTQLASVVRAILTDYEARSTAVYDDPGYGKLKEPLLRFTALIRGFSASSSTGRNAIEVYTPLLQGALESPSVFNFFEPGYVYPGSLAAAGLVAPEFQITNDTTAITVPNYLHDTIYRAANTAGTNYVLDLAAEQALLANPAALLDRLSTILTANQLSSATRTRITTTLNSLASTATALERAQIAVLLVATSLEGATQK